MLSKQPLHSDICSCSRGIVGRGTVVVQDMENNHCCTPIPQQLVMTHLACIVPQATMLTWTERWYQTGLVTAQQQRHTRQEPHLSGTASRLSVTPNKDVSFLRASAACGLALAAAAASAGSMLLASPLENLSQSDSSSESDSEPKSDSMDSWRGSSTSLGLCCTARHSHVSWVFQI